MSARSAAACVSSVAGVVVGVATPEVIVAPFTTEPSL